MKDLIEGGGYFMGVDYMGFLVEKKFISSQSPQKQKTVPSSKKRAAPEQFDGFFLTPSDGPHASQMSNEYPRKQRCLLSDGVSRPTEPSEKSTLEGGEDMLILDNLAQDTGLQPPGLGSFAVSGLGFLPWEEEGLFNGLAPPMDVFNRDFKLSGESIFL